jgi:predicted dehydrogenase
MSNAFSAIMVGCGAMSAEWLRSAKELGIEVAALVDLNLGAAQIRAAEFQLDAPLFDNVDAAIRESCAQMLFDCTIPAAHAAVDEKALVNGMHVLVEKPLATTLEDATRVVELAAKRKLVHAVIQNRRFNPGLRRIKRLLAQDLIGDLTTVNVDFFVPAHFGGFREKMNNVLLTDMAIHHFDAVRYLTSVNAEWVFCDQWNPKGSWWQHGASAHAIFHMNGGIRFTFRGSWCAEGLRTSWDGVWRIIGTKGTICWDGLGEIQGERVKVGPTGPVQRGLFYDCEVFASNEEPDPLESRGHFSVMRQFLRDVAEGIPAETRSEDNIHSLAMVLGAIESAKAGQKVAIRTVA